MTSAKTPDAPVPPRTSSRGTSSRGSGSPRTSSRGTGDRLAAKPAAKTRVAGGLAESTYQQLLEEILSGSLPGGTVVTVVGLAQRLKVSRTPVNEAMRLLAKDGLVEQSLMRRARVAEFTSQDVYDIYEMRKLLEGAAVEAAATRLSGFELARLRNAIEELARTRPTSDQPTEVLTAWLARWIEHDQDLHGTIAQGCGSRRLAQDILRYRLLHRAFNRLGTKPDILGSAVAEHEQIIAAMEARDGAAAKARMLTHIGAWQGFFVRHFPR